MNNSKLLCGSVLALFWLMGSPAYATASMECWAEGSETSISIIYGAGPILNPYSVVVETKDSSISTRTEESKEPARVAQFHSNDEMLSLDLIDDQANQHLMSLRVLRYDDGLNEPFQIGYVRIGDKAPIGVRCDGP